jgi:hypothetical protein
MPSAFRAPTTTFLPRAASSYDLIKPCLEQIVLTAVRRSFDRIKSPLFCSSEAKRITANTADQFARKSVHKPKPANTNICSGQKPMLVQTLLKSSRKTA